MKKINFEDLALELREMLENLVADKLDVNRHHIDVLNVALLPVNEVTVDDDPDYFEEYHPFSYRTRNWNEERKNFDYGDTVRMMWVHIEDEDGEFDTVCTLEDYEKRFTEDDTEEE